MDKFDDMLEQVDALAVGMTSAERGFVDVLMETHGALPPEHHAEIQRLYDRFVKPYGYNQPPEGSGS